MHESPIGGRAVLGRTTCDCIALIRLPSWTLENGSIREQGRLEGLASALAFFQIRISGFATACVGRMGIAFANKCQYGNMHVHVRHIFINLLL